ncbi:expressed unknown protein [Seminavis robusta]|uniref:Uncharacterized protein n=1 Tax=Seminavis robusta TaxID=568900 RepID=A0A9N8HAF6_9STRA|nr:expressed unknown protein [Seminavis robusta]|eukprot:Sro240_g096060.1 n/a (521) ;mRNA; r:8816-10861
MMVPVSTPWNAVFCVCFILGLFASQPMRVSARLGTATSARMDQGEQQHHHQPRQQQQPPPAGRANHPLPKLTGYGADPHPMYLPLPLCAGDCDTDDQCAEGLICYQRRSGDPVPGCQTNGVVESQTDFCIPPDAAWVDDLWVDQEETVTLAPTISPHYYVTNTEAPTFAGEHVMIPVIDDDGIWNATTSKNDTTSSTTASPTPSTIENARFFFDDWNFDDAPTASPTFDFRGPPLTDAPTAEAWSFLLNYHSDPVPLIFVGNDGDYETYPLGPCMADCDQDEDCYGNLVCFQRDGGEPVPGCLGTDRGRSDYCVFPHHLEREYPELAALDHEPFQNGFQLKLYWEEGYKWQNETFERHWCITRNYTGSPITGECWFGDHSNECNFDELYIDKCSPPDDPNPTQLFDFVPVSDDEVLIQAYNEDRCVHRFQRNITMETCDASNHRQRWFAVRGGFNEPKFELSQKRIFQYCLNQDHHPKPGEVIAMFHCEMIRGPEHETSWWELLDNTRKRHHLPVPVSRG